MGGYVCTCGSVYTEIQQDIPTGTRRNDKEIMTSKRRRFDVMMALLLRLVSAVMECLVLWFQSLTFVVSVIVTVMLYMDGLMQGCIIPIANTLEILQCCTEPSI